MGVRTEHEEGVRGRKEESVGVTKGSRANVGGRRGRELRGCGTEKGRADVERVALMG